MRYLTVHEVLDLHQELFYETGGSIGVRDFGALESALAQPRMTFEDQDLYPSLATKAAALCFSLVMNHPFLDGNKRIGHAAMEIFLQLNGSEMECAIELQEKMILNLAGGIIKRKEFEVWIDQSILKRRD